MQIELIGAHPTYDHSLWVFKQSNPVRKLCQACVEPGSGLRIHGRPAQKRYVTLFNLGVFAAILGSVIIAAVATPTYRQTYYKINGDVRLTWFNLTEVSLGMVFVMEFLVKIVADGFIFAPNAYLLSIWNGLDFFVLLTLVVNVVTALVSGGGVSRCALLARRQD